MSGEDDDKLPMSQEGTEVSPSAPADAERLREDLEAAMRRAEEYLSRAQRIQADYENLQKRVAREAQEIRELANEALLADLLPVLDDFDGAIDALPGDAGEGVRMLYDNLWKVLQKAGLEVLDPIGKPFDPYEHEVVGEANDEDLTDGTVKEVVQKGYKYRRRLLRPAKVLTAKRGNGQ